jgi:hypothetical protein
MKDINYNNIVYNIWNHYGDKLTEWETDFMDSIMNQNGRFSEKQKEVILKMNKKYVTHRQY